MHKQNFLNYNKEKKLKKKSMRQVGGVFFVILKLIPYFLLTAIVFIVLGAIIIGLTIAPSYATLKSVYVYANQGKENFDAVKENIKKLEFYKAAENLDKAKENFVTARETLDMLEEKAVFQMKYFMNQIEVTDDLLFIGEEMADALKEINEVGIQIKSILGQDGVSFSNITELQKGQILAVLLRSSDRLHHLRRSVDLVNKRVQEINAKQPLFIFNQVIDPLQRELPQLKKAADGMVSISRMLPAFAGYPDQKTYLLLLQNNREMRPSGGFLGAYGILKIKNAEMKDMFIDNVYNLDVLVKDTQKIEPPKPIYDYMTQDHWFFRDANWWPDFPASAEKAAWFYHEEGGEEELDGVIAFTPTLIENLMKFFGTSFSVLDLTLTPQNFWDELQYQVEFGYYEQGIEESDRKDVIGELAKMMMSKLYQLPMNKWVDLIDVIDNSVKEKHLLLYFEDESLQNLAVEQNWAGEVKQFDGDFFMLVDANLAALKTDSVMQRRATYNLVQDNNDDIIAEVKIEYKNTGTFSWKTTRYRTYTRLYVPEGAELISISSHGRDFQPAEIDTYHEFGKTAFGLFFEIEPQRSKEVVWKYKLPSKIKNQILEGKYNLMIQKQAGIIEMPVNLNLQFNHPIVTTKEFGQQNKIKQVNYTDNIRQDRYYTVWMLN